MSNLAAPKTIKEKLAAAAAAFKTGEDLQTKVTVLEKEHGEASALIERLTADNAAHLQTIAARDGTIAAHVASIATLTTERDGLKTQVDALPKKISDGVAEGMAAIGVAAPNLPKTQEGAPKTGDEHTKEYNRLLASDSTAAGAYFNKHRDQILTA